jgi:hypothetical protein
MRPSHRPLVALILGMTLGAACSVSLSDRLKYRCANDADCGGDGYTCLVAGSLAYCCKSEGAEVCDGVDNDCNGRTDEGFDLASDRNHCGACGAACAPQQVCNQGTCYTVAVNCNDGTNRCPEPECDLQSCGVGCQCRAQAKAEAACADAADNDGDLLFDCADPDCEQQNCGEGCACKAGFKSEAQCEKLLDHDLDRKVGCDDEDCVGKSCGLGCRCAGVSLKTEILCGDSQDNDGDATEDCLDPDCEGVRCTPFAGTSFQCNSGTCNCNGGQQVREDFGAGCRDLIDNDCNEKLDCEDPNCDLKFCAADGGTSCQCEARRRAEKDCADGQDNDGDGVADCADSDCAGATCGAGQTCTGGTCQ